MPHRRATRSRHSKRGVFRAASRTPWLVKRRPTAAQTVAGAVSATATPAVVAATTTIPQAIPKFHVESSFEGTHGVAVGAGNDIFSQAGQSNGSSTSTYSNVWQRLGGTSLAIRSIDGTFVYRGFDIKPLQGFLSGYWRTNLTPTVTHGIAVVQDGSSTLGQVRITSAGAWRITDGGSTAVDTGSSGVVVADTTYRLEWQWSTVTSSQTLRVWYGSNLEGVTPDVVLSGNFNVLSPGTPSHQRIGYPVGPGVDTTSYWDALDFDSITPRGIAPVNGITVAGTTTIPAPTVAAGSTITPAVVAATTTIPAPTFTSTATATPATVAATTTIGAPGLISGSTFSVTTVAGSTTIGAPVLSSLVKPATVTATTAIGTPTVVVDATATPTTVAGSTTIGDPVFTSDATISPDTVQATTQIRLPVDITAGTRVYATSHITGNVSDPDNALGLPDGVFTTDGNQQNNWTSRWAMDGIDPGAQPVAEQLIIVRARKGSNSGDPEITVIDLWENGVFVAAGVVVNGLVTETDEQQVTATFDGYLITNPDDVEIEITATRVTGSPSTRNSVEITSIGWRWNALYTVDGTTTIGTPTISLGANPAPATVNAVGTIGDATIPVGAPVGTVHATVTIGTPAFTSSTTVTVGTVHGTTQIDSPVQTVVTGTVTGTTTIGAPVVTVGSVIGGATVAGVTTIGAVTFTSGATVTPATVHTTATVGAPVTQTSVMLQAWPTLTMLDSTGWSVIAGGGTLYVGGILGGHAISTDATNPGGDNWVQFLTAPMRIQGHNKGYDPGAVTSVGMFLSASEDSEVTLWDAHARWYDTDDVYISDTALFTTAGLEGPNAAISVSNISPPATARYVRYAVLVANTVLGQRYGLGGASFKQALVAPVTIPTPVVAAGSTVPVTTVTGATTIGAPTINVGAGPTPPTVAGTVAIGVPVINAGVVVGATTVDADTAIGTPTFTTGSTVAAVTVAAPVAIPDPDISAGSANIAVPPKVSGVASIGTPVVVASSVIAVATVNGSADVGGVTFSSSAQVTAATVDATVTIGGQVATGATATPATVAATGTVGAATVQTSSNSTATPATVDASVTIAAVVQAGSKAVPGTVFGSVSIGALAVTASSQAMATLVLATTSIPVPGLLTSSLISASTVGADTAIAAPDLVTQISPTPDTVTGTATVGGVLVQAGVGVIVATVDGVTTIDNVYVSVPRKRFVGFGLPIG